jgi:hypothetical protein
MSTPRERLSAITHGDRAFHDPLDPAVVDEVLAFAALGPGDRALDIGCGPGELLVRLADRTGCDGLGVDLATAQIEEARRRAAARAPGAQLALTARPSSRGPAAMSCSATASGRASRPTSTCGPSAGRPATSCRSTPGWFARATATG